MNDVRCEYFIEERGRPPRSRTGRVFMVLPECEEPFKREMNGLMSLRLLARKFEAAPWWIRIFAAGAVFRAQFFIDRRHHSFWTTMKFAWRVTAVFSSPDWLQKKLAARWRRDYKKEAADRVNAQQLSQSAAATGPRAPASATPPAPC